MRVVIDDVAKAEIARHIAYIRARNPEAARRQRTLISQAVARLRDQPRLGKPGRVEGARELVIAGTPFLLVYELTADRLDITHVLHGRQQWPSDEDEADNPL